MKLWTIWSDYFATGEGVTYSAVIGYAKDEKAAKKLFAQKFSEYLAIGCEAKQGVVKNGVTKFIFSDELLKTLKKAENKANLVAHGEYHENRS